MKRQKYKKSYSKKKYEPKYKVTFISLDDPRVMREVNKRIYQNCLRDCYSTSSKYKKIETYNLEDIFSNKIYYQAMKELPLIEKKILYFDVFENEGLNGVCEKLNLTRKEVLDYHKKAIKHFKANVKKYSAKRGDV